MDPQTPTATPDPQTTTVSPPLAGEPPAIDPDADPESLAVEIERPAGKEPWVPLPALKQERERNRTLKTEKATAEQRAAALQQQLEAVAPLVQFVQNNPALLEAAQSGKQPTRTEPTQDDRDAAEMAEIMGLYRPDGSPDVVAGKRALALHDRRMQAAVAPVQQSSAQQAAEANYQRAVNMRDPQGRPYARPETILQEFRSVPPHLAADPQVAQVLLNQARAKDFDYLLSLPQAPQHAPIFSEPAGGRLPEPEGMTPQEQRVARERGISQKDWNGIINRDGGLWAPFKE